MPTARTALVAYLAVSVALLSGCSTSKPLTEARVQEMINESLIQERAKRYQEIAQAPAPPSSTPSVPAPTQGQHSAAVDSDLNYADVAFRDKQEASGCSWVTNAISNAAGGVSDDQARQLKSYAQRCGLRY